MTYTTEQLIQILDQELRATWKGQRLLLSSDDRLNDPVLQTILGSEKLSKVYAYQDFRSQIHRYQRENQISGLIWRTCRFQGKVLRFPERHPHLITIPQDKAILMAAKESVLSFWRETTANMSFWLAGIEQHSQISSQRVEELAESAEWTEIDAAQTELYLGLCWGKPEECHYRWAGNQSGCDRIIAAIDQPSSIKIY
ncbi:MAG: hypothetical protein ACOC0N_07800 [Chroococcales cyanobacterium]